MKKIKQVMIVICEIIGQVFFIVLSLVILDVFLGWIKEIYKIFFNFPPSHYFWIVSQEHPLVLFLGSYFLVFCCVVFLNKQLNKKRNNTICFYG